MLTTIGSSSDNQTLDTMYRQGKKWIATYLGEQDIFEQATKEADQKLVIDFLLSNVENLLLNGTRLILDNVFKSIGFDELNDDILKHLVTARLSQPMSKSA